METNMSENLKIAILFAGEYRTFPICRKTMKFLDQEGIDSDIYFSTWNVTTTESGTEEVNEAKIQSIVNRPVVVKINDPAEFEHLPIFVRQIHQRKFALDLVKNSGKQYDYIFLLRPDVFFQENSFFKVDEFSTYSDSFGAQAIPMDGSGLSDLIMFSNYNNIIKLLDGIDPDEANNPEHPGGWHGYFHRFVTDTCALTVKLSPVEGDHNIGVFGISEDSTFEQVTTLYFESMNFQET
jgi:hypothetical protein